MRPSDPPPNAPGDPPHRPSPGTHERATIWLIIALIAIGCLIRFWKLTDDGLWYDELWTVVGASHRPFMEMYRDWIVGDPHPPGYFLFYFAWLKLFPADEFWARIPNVIAGVLTVLYLCVGTHRVLSRDERLFAAAFAAFSHLYIFYSISVKQYSATVLLATVATITYLEIVHRQRADSRAQGILAAALVGLAYLDHFAMVYGWTLLALLTVAFRRDPESRRAVGKIAAVMVLAYLPIAFSLAFPLQYAVNTQQSQISTFLADILPSLFFADRNSVAIGIGVLVVALVVQALGGSRAVGIRSRRDRHVLLVFATFAVLLGIASIELPIYVVRYFVVLFPVALIGIAIATAAAFPFSRPWLAALPLVFFIRAAVVDFRAVDGMRRQEWDKSVDLVLARASPGDAVYVLGANPDRTMTDYLRAGDVDRVVYLKNVDFYRYYFRRRGAGGLAEQLQVVEPTYESVAALARRFRGSDQTVHILAGHHIQLDDNGIVTLQASARDVKTTWLYSTIVYEVRF